MPPCTRTSTACGPGAHLVGTHSVPTRTASFGSPVSQATGRRTSVQVADSAETVVVKVVAAVAGPAAGPRAAAPTRARARTAPVAARRRKDVVTLCALAVMKRNI